MRSVVFALLLCACSRSEQANESVTAAHSAANVNLPTVLASAVPIASAAPTAPALPAGAKRSVETKGYSRGLRLDSDVLIYCDDRGSRALDLASGIEAAHGGLCPHQPEERNGACDGIDYITAVREPGRDDIIDTKGAQSIPAHGHIHDCAFDAGLLIIASSEEIVTIDVKSDRHSVKGKDGGEQVAIDRAWIAWSEGKRVFAERR